MHKNPPLRDDLMVYYSDLGYTGEPLSVILCHSDGHTDQVLLELTPDEAMALGTQLIEVGKAAAEKNEEN